MVWDVAIVGAGLAGLSLGHWLLGKKQTVLIEKSRGVGGRLATRRLGDVSIDHGAQVLPSLPGDLHTEALNAGVLKKWADGPGWVAPGGMTALAKFLARDLNVQRERRVVGLLSLGDRWRVTLEDGEDLEARSVVVTAPLPQALDLLEQNEIPYPSDLRSRVFQPALVGLFRVAGYEELKSVQTSPFPNVRIVAEMGRKWGGSEPGADSAAAGVAVVMEADWSRQHYDAPEEETLDRMLEAVAALGLNPQERSLKRWRYAFAPDCELFVQPKAQRPGRAQVIIGSPLLCLAGDGLAGGDASSAVASARSALDLVLQPGP